MIFPRAEWDLGREEALPQMGFGGSFSVGKFQWGILEEAGPWLVPFRQRGARASRLRRG